MTIDSTMHYIGNTVAAARHRELMHSITLERKDSRGSASKANNVENLPDLRLLHLLFPKYEKPPTFADDAAPLIVHLPRFEQSVRAKLVALATSSSSENSNGFETFSGSVEHATAGEAVTTPASRLESSEVDPPSAGSNRGPASRCGRGTRVLPARRARRSGAGRS